MTDAAIVGTGPNGLAAAVTLARAGLKVSLFEKANTIGGGLRTAPLFDLDVPHDICSAVHPMAAASSFFRQFGLEARGVRLLQPDMPYAHPLPDGSAAAAWRSITRTAEHLGADGPRWTRVMAPWPLAPVPSSICSCPINGPCRRTCVRHCCSRPVHWPTAPPVRHSPANRHGLC